MDVFTKEQRSKVMASIRSRDTLPEMRIRKMLWSNGYRFRTCDRRIVGRPDIVIPRCRTLIEVRGCFWHHHGWEWDGGNLVQTSECAEATMPKSNQEFWEEKFKRNIIRDAEHERLWDAQGWNLIIVWECGLKNESLRASTFDFILRHLEQFS